jgi:Na+-translocating ferredoxin:NAD+ oxidoreductase subunit B
MNFSIMNDALINKIDDLLPQTQCGLCGFGGCYPYAQAIAKHEAAINLCPPGGIETLIALANLLNQDVEPLLDEMKKKEKPPTKAIIREAECIGCTKCIQACPIDAIIGSAKHTHTVISDECTGCELCVEPCPVDCIDMVLIEKPQAEDSKRKAHLARKRYQARIRRTDMTTRSKNYQKDNLSREEEIKARKNELLQAIARAKAKQKTFKHDS